ncbi:MAG: nucleotidyltransferase domain-containing protein [Chitinispirillales bacterium]|jgi:predicted nucleotidyltransferase|nr:nucleotidyltransferase domain-containing protein [Chitinispirillales bacterium]
MADNLGLENISAISAVLEKTASIQKAVVFGSRAKGNYTAYSDVDIALYGSVDFLEVESVSCELDELPFIYKFDVVAYSLVKNAELREHINRVGVVIYER